MITNDCYETGVYTRIADEYTICQHCLDKIKHENEDSLSEEAVNELTRKSLELVGQNVYKIGNSFLCKDCVKEIYDTMYADEQALDVLSEADVVELDKTIEEDAAE